MADRYEAIYRAFVAKSRAHATSEPTLLARGEDGLVPSPSGDGHDRRATTARSV
jgi:hypothetical protein